MYWSLNGQQYGFAQPVTDHITLRAEFQPLEKKNGQGFEVYVVDAVKKTRVPIGTEVMLTMQSIPEVYAIETRMNHYFLNPKMEEIVLAIGGRKFLGIQEYKVTLQGHYGTIGSDLDKYTKSLNVDKFKRIDDDARGPVYTFDVVYAHSKDSDWFGPQYGQVEGGVIEIVVDTEDNNSHLIQLDLAEGKYFDTTQLKYYVEHGTTFGRPIEEPLKRGYRFLGWFNGAEEYDFDQPVTAPLTLTAKYEEIRDLGSIFVQFELPDGSIVSMPGVAMNHKVENHSGLPLSAHNYGIVLEKEAIEKAIGKAWLLKQVKEFKAELKGRAGLDKGVANSLMPRNVTFANGSSKADLAFVIGVHTEKGQIEGGLVTFVLDAKKMKTFTITLDPNGGTMNGSTASQDVVVRENESMAKPSNPAKSGYRFVEWRKDGVAYNFGSPVVGAFTLFAHYEAINTGGNSHNQSNDRGNGSTTGTVEIAEEKTPLSNAEKKDDVLINGEKTTIKVEKNGTVVITEADLKDAKAPILLSFKLEQGNNAFVVLQKIGETMQILPFSTYLNGRMYVVIVGPGEYTAKDGAVTHKDVALNYWAASYLKIVGARQLMVGNEVGDFMPDAPTSRAMLTQILAGLQQVDLSKVTSSHYSDVPADKWYAASVNWATDNAIVSGIGENMFAPENAITREELAVMLHNFIKHSKWSLERSGDATMFQDQDAIADWAKEAVAELRANGLMLGKPGNLFDAKTNVTRAEVAAVVSRLIELYIKSVVK